MRQQFDLRSLGCFEEAGTLATARLKRLPGDLAAMRSFAYAAADQGDYAKAQGVWQEILEAGQATPQDLTGCPGTRFLR